MTDDGLIKVPDEANGVIYYARPDWAAQPSGNGADGALEFDHAGTVTLHFSDNDGHWRQRLHLISVD